MMYLKKLGTINKYMCEESIKAENNLSMKKNSLPILKKRSSPSPH